jgi:glycosyltransferase involved in cell wall biosynthesis
MRLSVVFCTRGSNDAVPHLQRILYTLEHQTFQDFQVLVVVDRKFENTAERTAFLEQCELAKRSPTTFSKTSFLTNLNSDFLPGQHNASYGRNFGMQHVNTELIQLFDDDNAIDETYLETASKYYDEKKKQM